MTPLARYCLCTLLVLLLVPAVGHSTNPLSNKLLDTDNRPLQTPRGRIATLEDLGLGAVPESTLPPLRLVKWATLPDEIVQVDHSGERLFFAVVSGKIYEYDASGKRKKRALLNIAAQRPSFLKQGVYSGRGLRGFALHPEFEKNGLLYTLHNEKPEGISVTHGETAAEFHCVLGEWDFTQLTASGDPAFRPLLRIGYQAMDHAGGQISFNSAAHPGDPDYGNLYIGLGEGGGPCAQSRQCIDAYKYGQNFSQLSAGIIRIHPQKNGDKPYSIPADNPFTSKQDPTHTIPDELFAKGFRNPSTLSFDRHTGKLFVGDISQNSIEEINLVESGKNYGWGRYEGTWIYTNPADTDNSLRYVPLGDGSDVNIRKIIYNGKALDRISDGITSPVAQFSHEGNGEIAAVVVGPVYRGNKLPELVGQLLFANLSQDQVFHAPEKDLVNDETPARVQQLRFVDDHGQIAPLARIIMGENPHLKLEAARGGARRTNIRFGEDSHGNIFLVSKYNHTIYRLESGAP